jgi:membrane associated rhomboid family serine protease
VFLPLKDENPTVRFPIVTVLLIAANCAVFFGQAFSSASLQYYVLKMGVIPYEITHGQMLDGFPVARISPFLAIFVSMFLHGGLFHLAGNMLYLWVFGNNVEDNLGRIRFILFYFVCGLGAALTHIVLNPNSMAPMIGASGAIAGVLGAYLILYPGARVLTLIFLFVFIRVIPIPAAIVLGLWFLMQLLNVGMGGGVAWFAHIGGFLVGIALVFVLRGRRKTAILQ